MANAGTRPNNTPVSRENPAVNPSTPFDADGVQTRQVGRGNGPEALEPDPGEPDAGRSAHERQHHALGQELADHAAPSGAECPPDGEFRFALHGSAQEQA